MATGDMPDQIRSAASTSEIVADVDRKLSPLECSLQLRLSVASADEWDQFGHRCHASFRCSYHGARAWQLDVHWFCRLRRFELYLVTAAGEQKVGQCAIGVGRRQRVFGDGIQLLPDHTDRWLGAMAAVLAHLGPGCYRYGSEWSIEQPREPELRTLPGVRVENVESTAVQVIDFQRWPSWTDYQNRVSVNVRRNLKKARRSYREIAIVECRGVAIGRNFLRSVAMRRAMFRRKGISRPLPTMIIRSAARALSMNRYTTTAYLLADSALRAFYVGIAYGSNFYYLEGASRPDPRGGSWHLLMGMIQRAFLQSGGRGKFIMGSDNGTQSGTESWEGLRRSRRQCCATSYPTSTVQFSYHSGLIS